jgi:hypothetical protein
MRGDDSVYGKPLSYIDRKKRVSADHPSRLIRRIANAGQFRDRTAGGLLPPGGALRRRSRRFEAENLLFLVVTGIVGAASAGSLITAAFVLLAEPKRAVRPVTLSAVRAQPVPATGLAKSLSPTSNAAFAPTAAAPPRITPAPASPAAPPPSAIVRFAMRQGDASFANGDVSVARYYYQQAVDAGDAEAVLRIGETFDPAFLTLGSLRRVPANREAARFWYRLARDLGAAQAKQRLDNLETKPAAGGYTGKHKFRRRASADR